MIIVVRGSVVNWIGDRRAFPSGCSRFMLNAFLLVERKAWKRLRANQ